MTDSNQPERKGSIRIFPVLLFFLIIAGLAWTAIQLVDRLPAGVSNFASLAESVNNAQQSILDFDTGVDTISLDEASSYNEVGDPLVVSWAPRAEAGSYFFSYDCTEGVALTMEIDGEQQSITCDTAYALGSSTETTVRIESEKDRYADVGYLIAFRAAGSETVSAQGRQSITVVNTEIDTLFADSTDTTPDTPTIDPAPTSPEPTPEPTTPTPEPTVAGATDTPAPPTVIETPVYITPVSNPDGTTDLATRLIGVGNIIDDTFFPQNIVKNHRGAVQFEVKNLGSKTSEDWTYQLTLPSGGTYTSPTQAPLKPNEQALITIGFPTPDVSDHEFTIRIATDDDSAPLNNRFTRSISFFN